MNVTPAMLQVPHRHPRAVATTDHAGIRFALASQSDDAEIRHLLRSNPMAGSISLSLEREPNYFADAHLPNEEKQTIIARESGRLVCAGSCTTRLRFVNGQPRRVGYLAGLRLDATVAGRFDILRRGYEFFGETQVSRPADFYFTSIAADNTRARSLLERRLRGMPRYEFIGEFVTLLLPTEPPAQASRESANGQTYTEVQADTATLPAFLNGHSSRHQLALHWTGVQLQSLAVLGLHARNFHFSKTGGPAVCAALWDQRSFKQTVIRGYAPWLTWSQPVINLAARMTRRPGLPGIGSTLSHAFVSHLAVEPDQTTSLVALVRKLSGDAGHPQIDFLTLGFAASDPHLAAVRKNFRCREYRSRIYVVSWPGLGGSAGELDGRCLAPEVATL